MNSDAGQHYTRHCCSGNNGTQTPHSTLHCTLPVLLHVNFVYSIYVWISVTNIQLCYNEGSFVRNLAVCVL